MPRKKQGLRSYHKKSRYGCMQCKRRRVKCNMQSPACGNCVRRNEVCEYPTFSESSSPQPQTPWGSESADGYSALPLALVGPDPPAWYLRTSPAPQTGTLAGNLSPRDTRQLLSKLLFSYSWFPPAEAAVWVPALANLAIRYPYLQHCLLAIVNLRKDLTDPWATTTPATAYQHHLTASSLFRQSLPSINEDNWMAVLAFGTCMLIFQFYTQMACCDDDFDLIETMRVLRSTMAIENVANPFFRRTQFWAMILARTSAQNVEPDVRLRNAMQLLAGVISSAVGNEGNDNDDEESAEINRQAFWELREWALECEGQPQRWEQYCHWPSKVIPEFLDLLADEDDIALLLLIHWAVIMNRSQKRVVKAWARRAAFYAIGRLHGDWSELLAWPLEELASQPPIEVPMPRRSPIQTQFPSAAASTGLELVPAAAVATTSQYIPNTSAYTAIPYFNTTLG